MQPVRMTRAEYEAKYGSKPVISTSTLDTTPAPIRMTRAEYEQTYGVKPFGQTQPEKSFINENFNPFSQTNAGRLADIPSDIKESFQGLQDTAKDTVLSVGELWRDPNANIVQKVVGTGLAPVSGGLTMAGQAALAPAKILTTDEFENALISKLGAGIEGVKESGVGQWFKKQYEQLDPGAKVTLSKILAPAANIVTSVTTAGTAPNVVKKSIDVAENVVGAAPDVATSLKKTAESFSIRGDEKALQSVVDEIAKVENKYKTIRKTNEFAKDVEGSRTRIAQSGVLEKAVDDSGKIDGKLAANLYKKQTIDGTEGIVRNLLEEEKATIKIEDIKEALELDLMKSRLEGKDLIKALDDIEGELKGFRLRADANGNIPLTKVHDFKISAADAVNWLSPTNEKIYRRTLANAYKTMIEKNSKIEMDVDGKKVGVKEINSRLGVYLEDARRLKALDGAIVDRGKLGKYQASLIGTGIGMAGGSMGGGFGAAAGGLIGGELASRMQGRAFQKTFQKGVKASVPEDKVLKAAKLRVPDKTVKAPEGLPKTEKAKDLEKAIAQNIEKQKAAIKANDFTLVARLKEIYQSLVEKLKEEVRFIRENMKDQSGFAKVPFVKGNQKTPRDFIQSKAINSPNSANSISSTVPKLDAEVKSNIVNILDDYTLNKNPDLELQMDAAKIAEDLGIKLPKTYGALVKKLGEVLDEAEAPKTVRPTGKEGVSGQSVDTSGDFLVGSLVEEAKKYTNKEMSFVYNTKKADLGQDFAQDVEPAGRYMNVGFDEFPGGEGLVKGKVTFKKPLVIEWETSRPGGWKTKLSNAYGGKTGKELSQAIIDDGYDGVIAVTGENPREAVNLQTFKSSPNPLLSEAKKLNVDDTKKYFQLLPQSYLKKPKVVYRGVDDSGQGMSKGQGGAAFEGYGLYTNTNKKVAQDYAGKTGTVLELDPADSIPQNPLYFREAASVQDWITLISKKMGIKPKEFETKVGLNNLIKELGYDGVAFDMNGGVTYVKYPD